MSTGYGAGSVADHLQRHRVADVEGSWGDEPRGRMGMAGLWTLLSGFGLGGLGYFGRRLRTRKKLRMIEI